MASVSDGAAGSRVRLVLMFVLHQFIATLGVPVAAPMALVLVADLAGYFGWTVYMTGVHRILTETPYFPVQIAFALALGWFLGHLLRDRSIPWVWVLPSVIMCLVVAAFPIIGQLVYSRYAALSSSSRLSHFFGWGCQPKNRCFDQLLITLPFYSAAAYSLGGLLAQRIGRVPAFIESMRTINKKNAAVWIGVPCFFLFLLFDWRELARNQSLRTGLGFCVYLAEVVLGSTIVTFVLVVVASLIGNRSFLRRLYRDARQ
jgi:hypothetical protein